MQKVLVEARRDDFIAKFSLDKERDLYVTFSQMVQAWRMHGPDSQVVEANLRELNTRYHTHFKGAHIAQASNLILEAVEKEDWLHSSPPALLANNSKAKHALAQFVQVVLNQFKDRKLKKAYSLLTKFLHLSFPDSFAIYDLQAAASIQMWSYLAFEHRGKDWQRFKVVSIRKTDGSGYDTLLEFYKILWSMASEREREELVRCAQRIAEQIKASLSILSLIDRVLWNANGDPLALGLLTPEMERQKSLRDYRRCPPS